MHSFLVTESLTLGLVKYSFHVCVCLSYHTHFFTAAKNDSRTNLLVCQGNFSVSIPFSFLPSADVTFIFLS